LRVRLPPFRKDPQGAHMRLCHRAGHAVPLLTLFTLFAGCATSTVPQPENFTSNPQVVAVYAVDSVFGTLPDVLIYSTAADDAGKISTNPPPSYGSYRVEFDQPINGTTVANNADRSATIGGNATFCSPLSNNPVQLVDVGAASAPIRSSVCYDATSPLGSHPHVLIVPGDTTGGDPLTCHTFSRNAAVGTGTNVLEPNHPYGIKVDAASIQNGAGKPLAAPTGVGWQGDTFRFTTSGFKFLAAGYQDPNTGFFVWLAKPEPGFEKDLAPVGSSFQKPADANPFFVVFSEPIKVSDPSLNDVLGPGTGFIAPEIALARNDDNSDPDSAALAAFTLGAFGDPRIAEIYPGDTYEPGVSYKVTVDPALKADSGDALLNPPASGALVFTAQPGAPAVLSTGPSNGAQAQAHTFASITQDVVHNDLAGKNPAPDTVTVVGRNRPTIEFSSPVQATAPGGSTPLGTFKLTAPAPVGDVPITPSIVGGANSQIIRLSPSDPAHQLLPGTTYTISWTGVRGAATPKAFANAPFPDGSAQFTTSTFRMAVLDDPKLDTSTSNTNIGRNGFIFAGVTLVAVNLDRRTDVNPNDLKLQTATSDPNKLCPASSSCFQVIFNDTAAGVDANSLTLAELNGTTATPIPGVTVAPSTPGDTTHFTMTLPDSYQLKFGQKYEVRAKSTITNPPTGKALTAEGCTPGGAADCSDVKSFTTRRVTASVAADPASDAPTGFRVNFSDPIDPASLTPILTTANHPGAFKLFQRNPDGSLSTTPTPINCTITSPTRVVCTAASGTLVIPNQQASYLASAVFLPTLTQDPAQGGPSGPAIASTSSDPSARFSGNASANIFAPCQ